MVNHLWLIPALPLLAAGLTALARRPARRLAAALAIGSMGLAFLLACVAFAGTLDGAFQRQTVSFPWLELGHSRLKLGWVLDPLSASMLVMVSLVGLLIFIYSVGYMARDANFTRFFCFMALFAAAMLGLVLANSLLLLFICWELVGLASYLLIGFWHHKPAAAAAARKAFLTTRIGDVFFFLGLLWLYAATGTALFYDQGQGCLEASAVTKLVAGTTLGGMAVSTASALLIFCGAIGKSGQVPLHVWLPDAMEGPTPVSALIHAATMVAAGVFLVARVYPLFAGLPGEGMGAGPPPTTAALTVVTWVGAVTAVFAALIAVAQTDLKRILAYSTVSQLGYMMLGLGVGGVAVGMFHLLTHAFFKALLFLGAGSVIHGCHDEQDIRRMGGLRRFMPVTFATYAVGMMALAGFPLVFSGFWSKDEILHSAWQWAPSRWPFYLGAGGALLTAFYMTRQVGYVFFGRLRGGTRESAAGSAATTVQPDNHTRAPARGHEPLPHESPRVMTVPLLALAAGTVLLSLWATPLWPWFHAYLSGHLAHLHGFRGAGGGVWLTMLLSTVLTACGVGLGWWLYGRTPLKRAEDPDALERLQPDLFTLLRRKFYVDEFYAATVVRFQAWSARVSAWLDEFVWHGLVLAASYLVLGMSWLSRLADEWLVDLGFDKGCGSLRLSGRTLSRFQNGQAHRYLRVLAVATAVLALLLLWGCS